ncbi:hypothetical protein IFM89_013213 [Coptis chinensis]|uniref:Protein CHUP1, chloroplastic n=1 Tax=Coptis chinensis TaxID=261450 RepID=A0A835IRX9_9MAGN|nr:hypothetical protein IFM89_013213 [Coptis chinensis]
MRETNSCKFSDQNQVITFRSSNVKSNAQVYPHVLDSQKTNKSSTASRDLFIELDHLRDLLKESKEREQKLRDEVHELKSSPRVSDLEREVEVKRSETDNLIKRVLLLESEKTSLSEQVASLSKIAESREEVLRRNEDGSSKCAITNLEMEVVELRRINKELQFQKRNLSCQLSTAESHLAALEKISQNDIVAKVEAEASVLRHTNEDLCKQVESLQMSRLTEVEELVYLRWVNSCLRNELQNSGCSTTDSDKGSSPHSIENGTEDSPGFLSGPLKESLQLSGFKRLSPMKKMKWPKFDEKMPNVAFPHHLLDKEWNDIQEEISPRRRHSISGLNCCTEEMLPNKRRQSDGFICSKEVENEGILLVSQTYDIGVVESPRCFIKSQESNKLNAFLDVEKRALRVPNPPPRPSVSVPSVHKEEVRLSPPPPQAPPPPPPPPPPAPPKFSIRTSTDKVQRAPQVVEFYHSLMKRDSRKDSAGGGVCGASSVANVRSSMIDEIENRSSYLLAIKADIETQGEFVNSLIKEVNGAVYQDIEDVVAFVKWLDDELCYLVDERAVLKHFDWPERKADTLREAAFAYRDLKKLEYEVSCYEDDPRLPSDIAMKKMVSLSEKMERSISSLLRTRDALTRHCKEFQIPTDWMLDTGIIGKIKFCSVKLAKKYMKRVAMELQSKRTSEKDPALEYMLLQGVRFAFRIHQFAGGFDAETMQAFEELRNLAHVRYNK